MRQGFAHFARCGFTGFMLLWFAVIVPGHQRGVLTVPGSDARPACCSRTGRMTVLKSGEKPQRAPADPAKHCALCRFTATLDAPATPVLDVPESELLDILPIERGGRAWVEPFVCVRQSRAPPV